MTTTNVTVAVNAALATAVDAIDKARKQKAALATERETLAKRIGELDRDEVYWLGQAHALQALVAKASEPPREVTAASTPAEVPSDEPDNKTGEGAAAGSAAESAPAATPIRRRRGRTPDGLV